MLELYVHNSNIQTIQQFQPATESNMMRDVEPVGEVCLASAEGPTIRNDAADRKKNDGDQKDPAFATRAETLEEKAKELYMFLVNTAKKTDKRTILLAKHKIEAKAKEFFRYVVEALKDTKPNMLLAKHAIERKAKAFSLLVMEMMKQANAHNFRQSKEWLQLKSHQLICSAIKVAQEANYCRALQNGNYSDVFKRNGKAGLTLFAIVMMVMVTFRGNDSLNDGGLLMIENPANGLRGRALSATKKLSFTPSFQPSERSLHPKWELWHDMSSEQQVKAMAELIPFFRRYGGMIGTAWTKQHIDKEQICDLVPNSPSDICVLLPSKPCSFLSFGVNANAAFETNLGSALNCRGFAVDPSAVKNSRLSPTVTFQNLGMTLMHNHGQESPKELDEKRHSWNTTVPSMQSFLKQDFTDILKLECEGCETAMIRDILVEDPTFFHKLGQVSVMKYASKELVQTEEDLYYFGLMFPLLEEAGFVLVSSRVVSCKSKLEQNGCRPEFSEWGYTCGFGVDNERKQGRSCQSYLFAKKEVAYRSLGLPTI